jgi:hypothetical protein
MFNGFSRSKATIQLAMYYREKLLTDEEFRQFSEETRSAVELILRFR